MKALSLHPKWAAKIATGEKPEEYRTWKTPYRGDLLICASTYNDGWAYPKGHALCIVNLYDIKWSDDNDCYAWQLKDIRPVVPFPVKGKLHLYDVDDKLVKLAGKHSNDSLFDWWHELKIIASPQKKKAEVQKQQEPISISVPQKKREMAPKQEESAIQKRRRYRLRCIY